LKCLYPDTAWQQVREAIEQATSIHLIAHVCPDLDTIGSQLALYHVLKGMGKTVWMHNTDPAPRICHYLPASECITYGEMPQEIQADLLIAVDAGSLGRLGMTEHYFKDKTLMNIDHHASNTLYGDINIVDARYCATGAMIYDLIQHLKQPLNAASAAAIYAAVLTDTASFRLSTVSADVHRMVAELIDAGTDVAVAAKAIYQSHHKERFHLLSHALKTMILQNNGQTAWIAVDYDAYQKHHMSGEDTEGFIDYARSIDGVAIAVFMRESNNNEWKISLRGEAPYSVGELAGQLGGGGHQYAAGCTLLGSFEQVKKQVETVIESHLDQ